MRSRVLSILGVLVVVVAGLAVSAPAANAAPVRGQDSGLYFPITPVRAWDSRVNGTKAPLAAQQSYRLPVTGRLGVPAGGVAAVTINLTAVAPTEAGWLTVYPSGSTLPGASSINFKPGETRANTITVRIPGDGGIRIYNRSGATHFLVDVTGFYARDNTIASTYGTGGGVLPVAARLVDSRTAGTPLAAGQTRRIYYHPRSTTAPTERGLYLNVTIPSPTRAGYARVWNGLGNPSISTLNWKAGEFAPANTTAIGTYNAADNSVSFAITNRSAAPIHYVIDVLASYDMSIWDTKYVPYGPTRVLDTRTGIGVTAGKLGPAVNKTVNLPAALKGASTYGIVGNAVLLNATELSFIRVWDNDAPAPNISTVSGNRTDVLANGVLTGTNYATHNIGVQNYRGYVDAILDVSGYFAFEPGTAAPARSALLRKSQEARASVAAAAATQGG